MRSIALRHFEEVHEGRASRFRLLGVRSHLCQNVFKACTDLLCLCLLFVAEHLSFLQEQGKEGTYLRKEGLGRLEPFLQELLQSFKCSGKPLFSSTRSSES